MGPELLFSRDYRVPHLLLMLSVHRPLLIWIAADFRWPQPFIISSSRDHLFLFEIASYVCANAARLAVHCECLELVKRSICLAALQHCKEAKIQFCNFNIAYCQHCVHLNLLLFLQFRMVQLIFIILTNWSGQLSLKKRRNDAELQ